MDATTLSTALAGLQTTLTPFIAPVFTAAVAIFAITWGPKKVMGFVRTMVR